MFNRFFTLIVTLFASIFAFFGVAFADPATIDDMWTAVDLSAISSNVIALLIVVLGIKLVFVAFGYIRSALARARG